MVASQWSEVVDHDKNLLKLQKHQLTYGIDAWAML